MATNITIDGIDEAISNLNYQNPQVLKSKLVHAVRGHYEGQELASLKKIYPDDLVRALWETGDDIAVIKSKRKNLSSTKSALNKDLKRLYDEGKNPQGIELNRDNVFVMSSKAKDELLADFDSGRAGKPAKSIQQISQSLNAIKELLKSGDLSKDSQDTQSTDTLEDLRSTIQHLANEMGVSGRGVDDASEEGEKEKAEKTEADGVEAQEEEVVEEDDAEEVPEEVDDELAEDIVVDEKDVAEVEELLPDAEEDIEALEGALSEEAEVEDVLEAVDDTLEEEALPEGDEPEELVGEEDEESVEVVEDDELEDFLEEFDDVEMSEGDDVEDDDMDAVFDDSDILEEDDISPEELEEEVVEEEGAEEVPEEVDEVDEAGEVDEEVDDEAAEDIVVDEEEILSDDEEIIEEGEEYLSEEAEAEDVVEEVDDVIEEGEAFGEGSDAGLPSDNLGEDLSEGGIDEAEKARQLAEAFDGHLGTMERFYNQYLLIPKGDYLIGSKAPRFNEQPERPIRIVPFYIGKFPVTNALFEIFVEKTGYVTTAEKEGFGTVYAGRFHKVVDEETGGVRFTSSATVQSDTVAGACWYQPCGPGSNLHLKRNHPVVQVSLEDAMAFAAWTGKRLPTEEEWEASARTQHGLALPWGDDWAPSVCNTEDNAVANTTPVDAFKEHANKLGIADALGNVLEWTSSTWDSDPGNHGRFLVAKGGSWVSEKDVRLYSRFKVNARASSNLLGFRCVAF